MDNIKNENQNIVDEHRKMVIMTGCLSDFQLENIKKWPFIVFGNDLLKVEINYDFVDGNKEGVQINSGSVEYDFYFNNLPTEEVETMAKSMLTLWTKYLFWSDTKISFKKEGKKWQNKKK